MLVCWKGLQMSALGQKQTYAVQRFTPDNDRESEFPHKVMSALPPESDILAYDSRPTGSDPCQKTRDARCMAKMHTEELIACRRSGEPQHPLSYLCIAPTYSFVSLQMLERYLRMLVRPPSRALAFPCLEHAGSRFLSRHLRGRDGARHT
jgi:hypothetical protein